MTLVVDASAVYAGLVDAEPEGAWVRSLFADHDVAAPTIMRYEVASALRKNLRSGRLTTAISTAAVHDLRFMRLTETPIDLVVERAWELRDNFSVYDAAYVALAELLNIPLATLDKRLANGPGMRCDVLLFQA